jgi:hypothetical protein
MWKKYGGCDHVHTANGKGMHIRNICHAALHSPIRDLHIKNVLHVPSAHKSIAFVHRITSDNNVFLEFFIPLFSSLRIGQRRQFFIEEYVKIVSVL